MSEIETALRRKAPHVDVLPASAWEKEPEQPNLYCVVSAGAWTASPALSHFLARGIAGSRKAVATAIFHRLPYGAGKSSVAAVFAAFRQTSSGRTWHRLISDMLAEAKRLRSSRSVPYAKFIPTSSHLEAEWEPTPPAALQEVQELLRRSAEVGTDEQDEMLDQRWQALIEGFGDAALIALIASIDDSSLSPTLIGESIRVVAPLATSNYPGRVQELLELGLRSRMPAVRYNATLGIASGDVRKSLAALRRAVGSETISALRRDMEKVISRIQR